MAITINGDTGISGVAGTASVPALVGTDSNSGVYFGGTNRVDFSINGTAKAGITSAGNLQFDSGYGSVATAYGCRAWVNFNGTGTVAIRSDGNVTSITDNGTGDYTVNFTTAMPDANYTVVVCPFRTSGNVYGALMQDGASTPTTTTVRLRSGDFSGVATDFAYTQIAIFR